MYEKALRGREQVLGMQHHETLDTTHNWGVLLQSQGKFSRSKELLQRSMLGREKNLGFNHPLTLNSAYALAQVLRAEGSLDEARQLYTRILRLKEEIMGSDHMETHAVGLLLAGLLVEIGQSSNGDSENVDKIGAKKNDLKEARELYIRALNTYERTLGYEHPETLGLIYNLV
jgi:tetratricopeptide (TPR) repeat protein